MTHRFLIKYDNKLTIGNFDCWYESDEKNVAKAASDAWENCPDAWSVLEQNDNGTFSSWYKPSHIKSDRFNPVGNR